jgi:hypothetical protein
MEMKNKRGKFQRGLIKKCEEGDTLVHLLLTHQMITVKNRRSSKIKIWVQQKIVKRFIDWKYNLS